MVSNTNLMVLLSMLGFLLPHMIFVVLLYIVYSILIKETLPLSIGEESQASWSVPHKAVAQQYYSGD